MGATTAPIPAALPTATELVDMKPPVIAPDCNQANHEPFTIGPPTDIHHAANEPATGPVLEKPAIYRRRLSQMAPPATAPMATSFMVAALGIQECVLGGFSGSFLGSDTTLSVPTILLLDW